ncbi:tetratricopeptide repeat-containing sensor histidine kinase [Winogradskyella costae]|uniref:tetratricopeptide repeat-containing sensor histidine kinase n=1 Tax=Winogradskyella costae TaxID=2697008 RepID=UPI0015C82325|nr:hypothetical protein [Winogradskyella costae]
MKPIFRSFLFIYILLLVVCTHKAFAQSQKDSLNYYRALALRPQNASDLFKSQNYFNTLYHSAVKQGDSGDATNYLYYLASIAYKEGEYIKSEETAVKALGLLDTMTRSAYTEATRKSFYNLLGLMYAEQQNKPKAIELYNNAFKMAESASDSAKIYNNLSLVHLNFNDLTSAETDILKAYHLLPRIPDTITQALILDNYGVIASRLNHANGLTLMTKALELRQSQKDSSTIYTSYSHLAAYYYRIHNTDTSKLYALKSLQLAKSLNSASYKNKALSLLVKLSDDPLARAYKQLNDSLYAATQESLNQFAFLKYDNSEYKRAALESQLEKEKQESKTIYALLIASFIALVSVFLYFILRARHRKEKLQQVFLTESRISKEIHDEIASDVFQVMTRLENKALKHKVLKNELHNLYHKTRDISKKHSVLNADYPFVEYLEELLESYNDMQTNVIIKGLSGIAWDTIPQLKQLTLYRVLQELLINMKKHSGASIVVIMFIKDNKGIQVNYSDNGVGTTLKKRNGLQNTENRIQSINGSITFETNLDKGFKAKITL